MGWTARRAGRTATWMSHHRWLRTWLTRHPMVQSRHYAACHGGNAHVPTWASDGQARANRRQARPSTARPSASYMAPLGISPEGYGAIWILLGVIASCAISMIWMRARHLQARRQCHLHRSRLNASSHPLYVEDDDRQVPHANRACKKWHADRDACAGGTSEAMDGETYAWVPPGSRTPVERPFPTVETATAGRFFNQTFRSLRLSDSGIAWLGRWTDDSDVRAFKLALRALEDRQARLAQIIPGVLFHYRQESGGPGGFVYVAGSVEACFGSASAQWMDDVGCPLRAVHPDDLPEVDLPIVDLLSHGRLANGEFRTLIDGEERWLRAHVSEVAHDDASGRDWIGCWLDISDERREAEKCRIAQSMAERSAEARIRFLALMSHEIRTPMNGVLGTLELLEHSRLDARQRSLVRVAGESSRTLLRIIDDILDFSKMEAGRMTVDRMPFDPREHLDEVLAPLLPQARSKGLAVQVVVGRSVAGMLVGDSVRWRQIIFNLVSNAIKFTREGSVRIEMHAEPARDASQCVALRVVDTGIGIALERHAELFFPREPSAAKRSCGGTGLGLAIVQRLCKLLDLQLTFESEPGNGTSFVVSGVVPVAEQRVTFGAVRGRRILVQHPSPAANEGLVEHLFAMGAEVILSPDASLMSDAHMRIDVESPQDETTRTHLLLSARTAATDAHAIRIDGDPSSWRALCDALGRIAGLIEASEHLAGRSPTAQRSISDGLATRRILVVDDHPLVRDVLGQQLERLGWTFDLAEHGRMALQRLEAREYAMLLTDCHMPDMDGYELATRVRAMPSGGRIPIIALTANVMPDQVRRCLKAGMDDVISKPLRLKVLGDKIDAWMKSGRGGLIESGDRAGADQKHDTFLRVH